MIQYLGMKRDEVTLKYWLQNDNTIQMKTIDGHCIFYDNGCTIHSGKPWRCTQWPLHPSILSDQANFETIKQSCPGIDDDADYEEFCEKLRGYLEKDSTLK